MSFVTNSNSYPHTNINISISSVGVGVDGGQPYNNINTINMDMVHPSSVHPPSVHPSSVAVANTNASLSMAAASFANPFSLMNPSTAALLAHVDPSFDMAALLSNAMVQQHHMMAQQTTMAGLPLSTTLADVQPNTLASTTTNSDYVSFLNTTHTNNNIGGDQSQFICPPVSNTNDTTAAAGNITAVNNDNLEPLCKVGAVSGGEVAGVPSGGEVEDDVGGTGSTAIEAPFSVGDVLPLEEFHNSAYTYATLMNYEYRLATSTKTRTNAAYRNTYYRYVCCRAGKPPPKKIKQEGTNINSRPTRTSLKTECGHYISGKHPMKQDMSGRDEDMIEIVGLCLEHTNGCTGCDKLYNDAIKSRRGRKYTDVALTHLRKEVKAGRYTTHDVKSWLVDQGMKDATLEEATNLRYRLIKDLPIKGWKFADSKDAVELGAMEDYLFNEDLAREITAGGQASVDNLRIVHSGLRRQVKGYDSRITTDSERRFTATSWQTGRMRTRLRRDGIFIFIDDSRSGINTCGFCFWNVVVVDQDGRVHTVLGAMTMHASNAAVHWVLSSMVDMCPEAVDIVRGVLSDLGKFVIFIDHADVDVDVASLITHSLLTYCFYLIMYRILRCKRRTSTISPHQCRILGCVHMAFNDHRFSQELRPLARIRGSEVICV